MAMSGVKPITSQCHDCITLMVIHATMILPRLQRDKNITIVEKPSKGLKRAHCKCTQFYFIGVL